MVDARAVGLRLLFRPAIIGANNIIEEARTTP